MNITRPKRQVNYTSKEEYLLHCVPSLSSKSKLIKKASHQTISTIIDETNKSSIQASNEMEKRRRFAAVQSKK